MAKPKNQGRPDAVVIGAGVSGLTTAVCPAESGFAVRVDSDLPPAATTSAAAGAAWDPYPRDHARGGGEAGDRGPVSTVSQADALSCA